jgi:D-methionine transport system ATP-binding protein
VLFFVEEGNGMILLQGISKQYDTVDTTVAALKQIDWEVNKGDIYAVVGMSGAGKSTLLKILTGLEPPDEGSLFLFDVDLTKGDEDAWRLVRRKFGVVFQGTHLLQQKTVFENVALSLRIHREIPSNIQSKVDSLLAMVGLSDKANRYPCELSGGQQQRVGIARALATDPELLFLDEPTSALDALTTIEMIALIRTIHRQTALTVVVISHDVTIVKRLATKILVLEDGRVAEAGLAQDVLNLPQTPIAKALFGKG